MSEPVGRRQAGASAASEDRFDALLEQRFSAFDKRQMAREVLAHDAGKAEPAFDADHVRRKIRFRGEVPEALQTFLKQAIPRVLAFAAAQGLRLRDLNHEVHVHQRAAYEQALGKPVPKSVSLPAASFAYDQLYRLYTVRVVLADRPPTASEALAILRVVMARLLGDIWLREEVLRQPAYTEDVSGRDPEVTAAIEDQIRLLREVPATSAELEQALGAYAKQMAMPYPKMGDKVRRAFLDEALADAEAQKLPPERAELIEAVFGRYLEALRAAPETAVAGAIEAVEALNKQLNFLPPEEGPDYALLRERNPEHYLRAAKLRLEHQLEIMGTVEEGFAALEQSAAAVTPLLDEQISGHAEALRRDNLARPYLIPHARLSDELARQRDAFPFEVHAILQRMPPAKDPDKAFNALRRRISQSLYQRLYTALLDLKTWLRVADQGRAESFLAGERHAALKGQVSNFRFRRPMLASLNVRLGIVLDALEASPAGDKAKRFPVEAFGRAWSYYVSYRVTGQALEADGGLLPKFDAARYWQAMDAAIEQALGRGPDHFRLVALLRDLDREAGGDLAVLAELLLDPPGTFRFLVNQALAAGDGEAPGREQIARWAGTVMAARAERLKHRITAGEES